MADGGDPRAMVMVVEPFDDRLDSGPVIDSIPALIDREAAKLMALFGGAAALTAELA